MKKIMLIIMISLMIIPSVKAECYDAELVSWAEGVDIKRINYSPILMQNGKYVETGNKDFSYMLTLTSPRSDIKLTAIDSDGDEYKGEYVEGYNIYAIGCHTNLEDIKYQIHIYGSEESKCPGELLKTINYSVEEYNRYYKTSYCERYPEHELCQTFKDTSKISEEEFNKTLEEYIKSLEKHEEESKLEIILRMILEYGIYVLIPIILVAVIYRSKINKYLRREGDR